MDDDYEPDDEGVAAPFAGGDGDGVYDDAEASVSDALLAQHGHKTSAESQQVVAVLSAVLAVVSEQGLPPTPVALFAACVATLQHDEVQRSAEARPRQEGARGPGSQARRRRPPPPPLRLPSHVLLAAAFARPSPRHS